MAVSSVKYDLVVFDMSGTLVNDSSHVPFPGVDMLLRRLHAEGILLALATNLSHTAMQRYVVQNSWQQLFAAWGHTSLYAPKPNKEMLTAILLECGVEAHRALMVGDSQADVHMAKNAGVDVCAVLGSHSATNRQAVLALEPHFTVLSVAELWQIVC